MDIDFNLNDNNKFTTRVTAIIYNSDKTKVLLFKVEDGRDYYMLPGGRIEFFEPSKNAIKREIKEEIGYDLEFELVGIQENFLYNNDKKIMQYSFCYKAIYNGKIITKFNCKDHNNQIFEWIDINNIDEYKILPKSTCELIKNDFECVNHTVENITI